ACACSAVESAFPEGIFAALALFSIAVAIGVAFLLVSRVFPQTGWLWPPGRRRALLQIFLR
ncbi:MAG TPA: hypothetical protein VIG47_13435, partial [Gemmatimonadaceae bacterium]